MKREELDFTANNNNNNDNDNYSDNNDNNKKSLGAYSPLRRENAINMHYFCTYYIQGLTLKVVLLSGTGRNSFIVV